MGYFSIKTERQNKISNYVIISCKWTVYIVFPLKWSLLDAVLKNVEWIRINNICMFAMMMVQIGTK